MKHHQQNQAFEFVSEPLEFTQHTDREQLQYCLGATLYMPGTKRITHKLLKGELPGLTSMVMCMEDSIDPLDLHDAEANILDHLEALVSAIESGQITIEDLPCTFIRVRNVRHFRTFSERISERNARVLCGFVFPKFNSENAAEYLETLTAISLRSGVGLYGMPILEDPRIAYLETRQEELLALKRLMEPHKAAILSIRVGGTDFSSLFGVRRDINTSIYNIMVVRDCLSDIMNVFSRSGEGYTVSAPVWEYFLAYKREDISHLLDSRVHFSLLKPNEIINPAIDGLLREVIMDKANGFVGKTIIHPSHLPFVNGMQAVTREEHEDALQVLKTQGGVVKSTRANKMNEVNPHRNWAKQVALRAAAYGVIEDESYYLRLILGE